MGLEEASEVDKFDDYAARYTDVHAANLKATGEAPEYFARYKVDCLKRLGIGSTASILDFGCGIGNLTTLLTEHFARVGGYDPSPESLKRVRERVPKATFFDSPETIPRDEFDAVVMAGVLHHIPPERRPSVIDAARSALRPGGQLVVFEHNPFNPLTRRAVDTCPFDDDAILLKPSEVRRRLKQAGLSDVHQDYIVFFPAALSWLRRLEPNLGWLPVGAQTLTVGRRQG